MAASQSLGKCNIIQIVPDLPQQSAELPAPKLCGDGAD